MDPGVPPPPPPPPDWERGGERKERAAGCTVQQYVVLQLALCIERVPFDARSEASVFFAVGASLSPQSSDETADQGRGPEGGGRRDESAHS